jgi:hypothetical protein
MTQMNNYLYYGSQESTPDFDIFTCLFYKVLGVLRYSIQHYSTIHIILRHQQSMTSLHGCLNDLPVGWLHATVVVISLLALFSRFFSPKKKHLPPLPVNGPDFLEFLSVQTEGRLTTTQQEWIEKYGRLFTVPSPVPGIVPNFVVVADPALAKELTINQANQYRPPSVLLLPKPFVTALGHPWMAPRAMNGNGDEQPFSRRCTSRNCLRLIASWWSKSF